MTTLMKDSGIDWIGEIPKGWKVKRVKDIFKLKMGETILKENLIENGKIPVYSATIEDKFFGFVNESNSILKYGDIVIPARGNSIGNVKFVKDFCTSTQTTMSLYKCQKENFSKYFYYYLIGSKRYMFDISGTAIPQITISDISARVVIAPPLETQQKIADYLDVEVSKLDKQVSLLERKYALLGDYKDALIFETVTQGLDKAVPMKDSGIDWIGEIPKGWKVKRLKEISVLKKGEVFNSEKSKKDGLYPYINGGINPSDYSDEYNVLENNIAVSEGGASAGYSQFVKTKFWAGSHCYVIKPKNGNIKKYMYYILKGFSGQIMFEKTGSAMPNLQKTKFSNFLVSFVENLETQQKIADYLDVEVEKLDKQRELIKRKVELLKEYKEALIFEVVTGKKEVK